MSHSSPRAPAAALPTRAAAPLCSTRLSGCDS
jgi:hypothetical protein